MNMKKIFTCLFVLLGVAQAAWAQTTVTNESELRNAITDGANIVLGNDITIKKEMEIKANVSVTIDLNGKTLDRGLSKQASYGHVLKVLSGGSLTVNDSSGDNSGTIKGGYTGTGGAINNAGTFILNGGSISNNNCEKKGGGIWNQSGGTAIINGGVISNNNATGMFDGDGGGIYNEGTLTIAGGTITENMAEDWGGAIFNKGTLTLTGGTITGNKAKSECSGIYSVSGSTLCLSGNPVVKDNINNGNECNVYMKNIDHISVTGAFTEGVDIHLTLLFDLEDEELTAGYAHYNGNKDPNTVFTVDGDMNTSGFLSFVGGEVKYVWTEYVTDAILIFGSESGINELKSQYIEQGWKLIDVDLNSGYHDSDFIYMLYKAETGSVNIEHRFITDFYLVDGESYKNKESIEVNGRTYYKVPGDGNDSFKKSRDLNKGVNGDYIYLYYTKDFFDDERAATKVWVDNRQAGALGNKGGSSAMSLNKGCGSHFNQHVYMHFNTYKATTQKTTQALWCAGNSTLYFVQSAYPLAVGDTYDGQTITAVVNGTDVSNTGNNEPLWGFTTSATKSNSIKRVVFDESFANEKPKSLYRWFADCRNLTDIEGIGYLNTSECTTLEGMFSRCSGLVTIDVSGFDVGKVTNSSTMFYNCSELKTIFGDKYWNSISRLGGEYSVNMFYGCVKLVGSKGTFSYDPEHVNAFSASPESGYFTPTGAKYTQALWCEGNKTLYFVCPDIPYAIGETYDGQTISDAWSGDMILNTGNYAPGWVYDWTVGENIARVVFDPSFATARPTSLYGWFMGSYNLATIEGLEYLNTLYCTNMSRMFAGCHSLTTVRVGNFLMDSVTDTSYMFYCCSNLKVIASTLNWSNYKGIKNSTCMFYGCEKLRGSYGTVGYSATNANDITNANSNDPDNPGYFTSASDVYTHAVWCAGNTTLYFVCPLVPLSVGETYDGQTVTNLWSGIDIYFMSMNTPGWDEDEAGVKTAATRVVFDESFDVARVKSLNKWFCDFEKLTTIEGLENLTTGSATIMNSMFSGCSSLESIDLTGFDVRKVTDTRSMFAGCSKLKTIYCDDDWSTITSSEGMFTGCTSLKGVVSYNAEANDASMASPTSGYFMKKWTVRILNDDITVSNPTPYTNETVTISGTTSPNPSQGGETAIVEVIVTGLQTGTDIAVTTSPNPSQGGETGFSFIMPAEDVSVREEINIAINDGQDNSEILRQYNGKTVNVTYSRTLSPNSQIVNSQIVQSPKAYTICLPYDLTLSDNSRIENGKIVQSLTVYNMAGVYSQPNNYVFTFAKTSPEMKAGMPYLVVVEEGTVSLNANAVVIHDTPSDGVPIYEIDDQDLVTDHLMGYWRGTFQKIESADAAAMFAYGLQSVGDFRRIRPDTPWAWFDSFRSLFCAAVPEGADPTVCPLPSNRYTIGLIRELGGDADEHGPLPFPVDNFEGDTDIPDDIVGIHSIDHSPLTIDHSAGNGWYDLQGRRMDNGQWSMVNGQLKKGVYINNGHSIIIK